MANIIVFTTSLCGDNVVEQRICPTDKTFVVLSKRNPHKGTKVATKFFLEALEEYLSARQYLHNIVKTNYVDVDLVLEAYEEIMAHEEELLFDLIFG